MAITPSSGAGSTPSPGVNANAEILAKAALAAAEDKAATSGQPFEKLKDMPEEERKGVELPTELANLTIADLRAGALDPSQLQGLMALLGVKTAPEAPKRRWEEFSHVYQFPSAPTSFHFSFSKTGKVNIPEGIYGTNDAKEIEELEAAADVGNIWRYSPDVNYQELAPTTKIPQPVRTDALN